MSTQNDNLRIVTLDGDAFIRTSFENGVHYPHHYVRLFAADGAEYSPDRPLPVALYSVGGVEVVVESGNINVNLDHENDSVVAYGEQAGGSPTALLVDADGHLQVDIASGGWQQYEVDTIPDAQYSGTIAVGLQPGSPGPVVSNGTYAPLQFANNGALLVSLGTSGASGSFTTTDGKTVTVVNGYITSIT